MSRFLLALVFIFSLNVAHAEDLSPPISGDMTNLVVLKDLPKLPSVFLSSQDKGLVYLSEYKTKLVVLNIWATWCPPCMEELPSLNALQHAMGSNMFDVVTVSIDTSGLEPVKKYLTDNRLDMLPAFVDANQDIQKLEVLKGAPGVPITLILDPQQHVLAKFEGTADWNGPAARAVLEYYAKNVSYSSI